MLKWSKYLPVLLVSTVTACQDSADPNTAPPDWEAQSAAAEAEAMAVLEAAGPVGGVGTREFERLLLEEERTGVPMDRADALRALEVGGMVRRPRPDVEVARETTAEEEAQAAVAEAEALAVLEAAGPVGGVGTGEFERLLLEEWRTGVPMDRADALRALEASGFTRRTMRGTPWAALASFTGTGLFAASDLAASYDTAIVCDFVRDVAFYGDVQDYLAARARFGFCRSGQQVLCRTVHYPQDRIRWFAPDGRRVSRVDVYTGRDCGEDDRNGISG